MIVRVTTARDAGDGDCSVSLAICAAAALPASQPLSLSLPHSLAQKKEESERVGPLVYASRMWMRGERMDLQDSRRGLARKIVEDLPEDGVGVDADNP